jgi:DNA-binding response OmpR family regulator
MYPDLNVSPLGGTAQKNHVLIADDDDLGRRALCRLLEREGYTCHEANSSDAARAVLASVDIALIIADINMEGNNRLEFIKGVREVKRLVSIILITGHASVETAAAATALNAAAYLLKPLAPLELLQLVRREFEQQALFQTLLMHRQKQERMQQSMREMEEALTGGRGRVAGNALESYLALSFEQAIQSLLDLRALVQPLIAHCSGQPDLKQLNASRPLVLVNALQETIQVLESTRHSFKSKELAALRLKLEALLKSAPPGAGSATTTGS